MKLRRTNVTFMAVLSGFLLAFSSQAMTNEGDVEVIHEPNEEIVIVINYDEE